MPRFERACRLCGKKVSSLSGLTRHTEICLRKRQIPSVANFNNTPATHVHASSEPHAKDRIPQKEIDDIEDSSFGENIGLPVDSQDTILFAEPLADLGKQAYYWFE